MHKSNLGIHVLKYRQLKDYRIPIIKFQCLNKLSQFVKTHKDKDHLLLKSNVIYKIFCKNCEATYIGQTKRQLRTRLKEHKNNLKQDQSRYSVISEYN